MGFSNQRGSAIVFALGVTVLVVGLATILMTQLRYDIRRVDDLTKASQRQGLLHIAEKQAEIYLADPYFQWDTPWELEANGLTATIQLADLSARFNLNVLYQQDTPEADKYFYPEAVTVRVLEAIGETQPLLHIEAIRQHKSTLHSLKDYPALAEYREWFYTALPNQMQVNVNTASPRLVGAMLGIDEGLAIVVLTQRPFESLDDFKSALVNANLVYEDVNIDSWFRVGGESYELQAILHTLPPKTLYTIIKRKNDREGA